MPRRTMDRLVLRLLERTTVLLWGFHPSWLPLLVSRWGAWKGALWLSRHLPVYERIRNKLGPLRHHLACLAISIHNESPSCTFGHAYALDLTYFKEHGTLFPVDADTVTSWIGLPRGELRQRIADALVKADLHAEVIWLDRTLDIVDGTQQPVDHDEARVAYLARVIGALNGLARIVDPDVEQAHDAINKNSALKSAHTTLRHREEAT